MEVPCPNIGKIANRFEVSLELIDAEVPKYLVSKAVGAQRSALEFGACAWTYDWFNYTRVIISLRMSD